MSGIVIAAMIGSVMPDIDMLYFHFVDGGRTHHHAYFTHLPLFWAAGGILTLSVGRLLGWPHLPSIGVFFAGAMLHMVLDTVASPIMWLMPFDRRVFELVTVPAAYGNWVASFRPALDFRVRTSHLRMGFVACAGAIAASDRRASKGHLSSHSLCEIAARVYGHSSVGRAAVSKTAGRRFEPCCPCHFPNMADFMFPSAPGHLKTG